MFRDGLAPLADRGQLGSILLQYPKWVFPSNENRALIEEAVERLDGWKVAVEFRNGHGSTRRSRADQPLPRRAEHPVRDGRRAAGFKSSVPAQTLVTSSDLALVRFHGRNADGEEGHHAGGALPVPLLADELSEWVPRIREAASEAREVHLMFNNCYANYGTTNAREIAALLAELELAEA